MGIINVEGLLRMTTFWITTCVHFIRIESIEKVIDEGNSGILVASPYHFEQLFRLAASPATFIPSP